MRRKASLILLAFAVFFTALSPLVRWYAFPRLAKVPANQYQETVLEAKDATLINYDSLKAEKVPKVTIVQTLKGNVEESNRIEKSAGKDVVVWDALSYIVDSKGEWSPRFPSATSSTPTARPPCTRPARWSTATRSPATASSSSGPS